jgi:hypothetical protein
MSNASVPTERSRHIDISYFAIQDWKSAGDILLRHIPAGILNASDTMTKAVGWILHNRHARRLMGHYGCSSLIPPFDFFLYPTLPLVLLPPSEISPFFRFFLEHFDALHLSLFVPGTDHHWRVSAYRPVA